MILVDTSVWIELLNGRLGRSVGGSQLRRFVTCGPVAQEVRQGLKDTRASAAFLMSFDALPRLCDPLPERVFLAAADVYRQGRRLGISVRSSTDCLIAAIAIECKVPVWHRDRDFDEIARFTALEVVTSPG